MARDLVQDMVYEVFRLSDKAELQLELSNAKKEAERENHCKLEVASYRDCHAYPACGYDLCLFLPAVRLWACALRMRVPQDPDLFHEQDVGLGVVHSHLLGRPCNEHQTHANHGCRDGTQEIMQAEARQAYVHRGCTNRREIYIQYTSSSSSTYCEKLKKQPFSPLLRSTYCANKQAGAVGRGVEYMSMQPTACLNNTCPITHKTFGEIETPVVFQWNPTQPYECAALAQWL